MKIRMIIIFVLPAKINIIKPLAVTVVVYSV